MKYILCLMISTVIFTSHSALTKPVTLSGTVQDQASRHTLMGANIFFINSRTGTTSDRYGRFNLRFANTVTDTLVISYIGYEKAKIVILPDSNEKFEFHIALKRLSLIFDELIVEGDRYADDIRFLDMDAGAVRMNLSELRLIPYAITPDINRSLMFLPGVISSNDLTNELNVRGGSPDQNLVLLEGVPVYYPFHVFGLASAFNPDLIGEVHFSPGGCSAQYGERLGSVMNVRAHSPQKSLETSADISLIATDLTASGRWNKRFEWIVSGRKSYYDLLFKGNDNQIPYAFYDLFTRVAFTPDSNNTISAMLFGFRDRFRDEQKYRSRLYDDNYEKYTHYQEMDQRDYSWQNQLASVSWDRRWNKTLSTHIQGYSSIAENHFNSRTLFEFPVNLPSEYEAKKNIILEADRIPGVNVTNQLTDYTTKLTFDWKPNSSTVLTGGIQHTWFNTDYGWGRSDVPTTPILQYEDYIKLYFDYAPESQFDFVRHFKMYNGYIDALRDITPSLHLRAGIRSTKWSVQDKKTFEPRINVNYDLSDNITLKTAYGHYTQGISTALEDGVIGFMRLYFPVGDSLSLETADHYILGFEYLTKSGHRLSINAYMKDYNNLIKSVGPAPNFIQTPGKAYGLELFSQWKLFGWNNWTAFTLARSYRTIDGTNYDTNWDQRYRIDIYASKSIFKNWKFSCSWVLYSGVPYSMDNFIAGVHSINWETQNTDHYTSIFVEIPPNHIRYPWYHRLDISLTKEFHFSTWHMEMYLSVRNAYSRKNPLYYKNSEVAYFTRNGEMVDYHVEHPFKWLPPIPTVGIRVVR
ncbi:TonB-dependent receptor [candidate division KSB1 bacterium]|nr:TonB-dependent receptor [candidate division KSB1 bacterium]